MMSYPSSKSVVLYITYDGLMEPLGQSQVLPYLRGLANEYAITILSFEKPKDLADSERRNRIRGDVQKVGIEWIPLRYHKRPSIPATGFDVIHGIVHGLAIAIRKKPCLIHVRGYVPGVIGLVLRKIAGAKFIFDMRGFWPDEKVDSGAWRSNSEVYRAAKWFEKMLLQQADVVVSLTQVGVAVMREFPYLRGRQCHFEVIPTCTDLLLFCPLDRQSTREKSGFTLGYVGSVGTFYLFDEVLECFKELLKARPDARLLIVNRGDHDHINARLRALGTPLDKVELHSAEYRNVPRFMRRMDAGAFFIKPVFSKKSSAPTRLGEFLGCGVPCLVNAGVGDQDAVVSKDQVGVIMSEFSPEARKQAVYDLLRISAEEGIGTRCVESAQQNFALDRGVLSYQRIYGLLQGKRAEAQNPRIEPEEA